MNTPQERIAWLREQVRAYARDLALQALVSGDQLLKAEIMAAVIGFGLRCEAPAAERSTAWKLEWQAATAAADQALVTLQRTLWPMCRAQLPVDTIRRRAVELLDQNKQWLPEGLLLPLLAKIDAAARPGRKRHARS